jgi:hypothetical protein
MRLQSQCAQFRSRILATLRIDAIDDERGTRLAQPDGNRLAETARRTCNESRPALEIEQLLTHVSSCSAVNLETEGARPSASWSARSSALRIETFQMKE